MAAKVAPVPAPVCFNASPESAVGGGLALLQTGDRLVIDLNTCRCDALVPEDRMVPTPCRVEAHPC